MSKRISDTESEITLSPRVTREMLDAVISTIMNERYEDALLLCESLGMCDSCIGAASPRNQCLPVRLLEASLTTHREDAYEAYMKLKGYLEERRQSYQEVEGKSA